MALFNNWQNAPKVIENGRVVKYSSTPEFWNGEDITVRLPIYYTLTRSSSMTFSILGLTKAAAETGAKALRDEYTRRYMRWNATLVENPSEAPTVLINQDTVFECGSAIEPKHTVGDTWQIDASITEEDVIVSLDDAKEVADFESLFQLAEQREDTSSGGSIAIAGAKWISNQSVIEADYNAIISNFDWTKVTVEVKGDNDTWTTIQRDSSSKKGHIVFTSATNATFRLRYNNGTIVSKAWTTKDREIQNIVLDEASFDELCNVSPRYSSQSWWTEFSTRFTLVFHETTGLNREQLLSPSVWRMQFSRNGRTVCANIKNVADVGGCKYAATTEWISGLPTNGHDGFQVMLCFRDEIDTNLVTAKTGERIDMSPPTMVGFDPLHDTPTSRAIAFTAFFATDLPAADITAANIVVGSTSTYRGEGYAIAGTVSVSPAEGGYSVAFTMGGFSPTATFWSENFFVKITSGGTTYRSQYCTASYESPVLTILSVTSSPGLTLEFSHRIENFDNTKVKIYRRRTGYNRESGVGDNVDEVTTTWLGNNRFRINDNTDGRFYMKYTDGETVYKSDYFSNANIAWIELIDLTESAGVMTATFTGNLSGFDTSKDVWYYWDDNSAVVSTHPSAFVVTFPKTSGATYFGVAVGHPEVLYSNTIGVEA